MHAGAPRRASCRRRPRSDSRIDHRRLRTGSYSEAARTDTARPQRARRQHPCLFQDRRYQTDGRQVRVRATRLLAAAAGARRGRLDLGLRRARARDDIWSWRHADLRAAGVDNNVGCLSADPSILSADADLGTAAAGDSGRLHGVHVGLRPSVASRTWRSLEGPRTRALDSAGQDCGCRIIWVCVTMAQSLPFGRKMRVCHTIVVRPICTGEHSARAVSPARRAATKFVLLSIVVVFAPGGRLRSVATAPTESAKAMTAPPWRMEFEVHKSSRTKSSAITLSALASMIVTPINLANGMILTSIIGRLPLFRRATRRQPRGAATPSILQHGRSDSQFQISVCLPARTARGMRPAAAAHYDSRWRLPPARLLPLGLRQNATKIFDAEGLRERRRLPSRAVDPWCAIARRE